MKSRSLISISEGRVAVAAQQTVGGPENCINVAMRGWQSRAQIHSPVQQEEVTGGVNIT